MVRQRVRHGGQQLGCVRAGGRGGAAVWEGGLRTGQLITLPGTRVCVHVWVPAGEPQAPRAHAWPLAHTWLCRGTAIPCAARVVCAQLLTPPDSSLLYTPICTPTHKHMSVACASPPCTCVNTPARFSSAYAPLARLHTLTPHEHTPLAHPPCCTLTCAPLCAHTCTDVFPFHTLAIACSSPYTHGPP